MWHSMQLWDLFLLVAVDAKNTNDLKQQRVKLQKKKKKLKCKDVDIILGSESFQAADC